MKHFLNKSASKFTRSPIERQTPIFFIFKYLVYVLLAVSVASTANYCNETIFIDFEFSVYYSICAALFIASLIAIILPYVLEVWHTEKNRVSWLIIILIPAIGANTFSDFHGVKFYAESKVEDIVYISSVDDTYNSQRADLNQQIKEQQIIIGQNRFWHKGDAPNWHKHNLWKKANDRKKLLEDNLLSLTSSYNENKKNEMSIFQTAKSQRDNKVSLMSDSFRGVIIGVNVLIILMSVWRADFIYRYSQTVRKQLYTVDEQEVKQSVQTQTQTPINSLSAIQVSKNGLSVGVNDEEIEGLLLDGNSVRATAKLLGVKNHEVARVSKYLHERGEL